MRRQVPQLLFAVTASAGLACVEPEDTLETALRRADRALYAAKDAGRDRSLLMPSAAAGSARVAQAG